ncbi:MAG: hypothetical protein WCG47_33380 [Dermatophilaceae bacterium]
MSADRHSAVRGGCSRRTILGTSGQALPMVDSSMVPTAMLVEASAHMRWEP